MYIQEDFSSDYLCDQKSPGMATLSVVFLNSGKKYWKEVLYFFFFLVNYPRIGGEGRMTC